MLEIWKFWVLLMQIEIKDNILQIEDKVKDERIGTNK